MSKTKPQLRLSRRQKGGYRVQPGTTIQNCHFEGVVVKVEGQFLRDFLAVAATLGRTLENVSAVIKASNVSNECCIKIGESDE